MPLKVLVVEDEALIAINLIGLLEDHGHQVYGPAANAAQALAIAGRVDLDLAFVDLKLLDGLTGASVAHALAENQDMTVAVFSATPEGVTEGQRGIFRVIRKPYRDQVILEVVSRALARREHRAIRCLDEAIEPSHAVARD